MLKKKSFLLSVGNLQTFNEPPAGDPPANDPPASDPPAFDMASILQHPDFVKFIQSSEDKVRTEYSNKNKELQKQLDLEKKSTMTEQEKFEAAQKELIEKEKTISERENRLFAIGALGTSELPASFIDFVVSDNEEGTNAKILSLKTEFDKAVAAKVEDTIKGTGRKHQQGADDKGGGVGSSFAQQANTQAQPITTDLWKTN
jgi:hypothetical protein